MPKWGLLILADGKVTAERSDGLVHKRDLIVDGLLNELANVAGKSRWATRSLCEAKFKSKSKLTCS